MKESFGFHEYVDLNTGVLLSATLFTKVVDPANCHDQKTAGGTSQPQPQPQPQPEPQPEPQPAPYNPNPTQGLLAEINNGEGEIERRCRRDGGEM